MGNDEQSERKGSRKMSRRGWICVKAGLVLVACGLVWEMGVAKEVLDSYGVSVLGSLGIGIAAWATGLVLIAGPFLARVVAIPKRRLTMRKGGVLIIVGLVLITGGVVASWIGSRNQEPLTQLEMASRMGIDVAVTAPTRPAPYLATAVYVVCVGGLITLMLGLIATRMGE